MTEMSPNVVQATGQVATEVIGGLKGNPMLLAIIILNVFGLALAGWFGMKFLEAVERGDHDDRLVLRELMENNRTGFITLMSLCFPDKKEQLQYHLPDRRQDRQDR